METSEFTIPLFFLTFAVLTVYWKKKRNDFVEKYCTIPKIPYSLPIFGNLLQMGSRPYVTLMNWSQTYGPIFRARLGSQDVIVLNGTDIIREAIVNHSEEFAGRPYLFMTHATLKGKGIISSPYNKDYSEHKKFLLNSLNRFGRRRSSLEVSCLDSIREHLNEYREHADEIIVSTSAQLKNKLSQIASKNVLTMTFGVQIYDKNKFSKLMDLITANFQNTSIAAAFNFIPCMRIFQTSILKNVLECSDFLKNLIKQHAENYNPGEEHNIVDAYLNELKENISVKKTKNVQKNVQEKQKIETIYEDFDDDCSIRKSRGRYNSFSIDHLNSMVQDLFIAGTETIANALNWAIVYAAYFPDFQQKCQDEIDKCIGRERVPCANDRQNMHYIEAFMNETLRFHCAGPILIPRSTTTETSLKGYKIPANTFILLNIWSCMRDKAYWIEPDKFDPSRFLTAEGVFQCKNAAMMPFSAGARACVGETLARLELFIIFTSILQKLSFYFSSDDDVYKNPNFLDGIPGITLNPPNVTLRVKLR
jgi:cytochrome P450